MKPIIFKPKPLTKAEKVYLDQLAKRPSNCIFNAVFSKVQQYHQNPNIVLDANEFYGKM